MTRTQAYNSSQCSDAAEAVRGALYLVPSFFNTCSAAGTFFVFVYIYIRFSFRIYYHINAKILIFLNMMSFLSISLATLINYGTLFINALLATDDCDFLFLTPSCSFIRRMFLFSIMLTTLTHASLTLERAYATYQLGAYEKTGPRLGLVLGGVSLVGAVVMVTATTSPENSGEMLTNCFAFSSSPSIGDNVYNMFRLQLALEIGTWVMYFILVTYHKMKVRQQVEGHLADRFQAIENMIVLRQLRPLILISSAIIGVYIIFSSTGRFLRSVLSLTHYKQFASIIFVMPHNAFISMTLYYYLFKWGFQEKKKRMEDTLTSPLTERKTHMQQLQEQWNDGFRIKELESQSPRTNGPPSKYASV